MRLALGLLSLLSLCVRPVPPAASSAVEVRACLVAPPPERARFRTVRDSCPEGLVCLTEENARAMATELEQRRDWDAMAWGLCGSE